jgi:hypothetical protein
MTLSTEQQWFVNLLRSELSMRVTPASGSSYQLAAKLGDEELWEDTRLGLNYFNSYPPIITTYSCKDIYNASQQSTDAGGDPSAPASETLQSVLTTPVLMCAMFFVGIRLQWFEAGKHFQFSDNGISVIRDKQPKYQSIIGQNILQYITITLTILKTTLGFSRVRPKGAFSGMVSYPRSLTRGLRGTRTGFR